MKSYTIGVDQIEGVGGIAFFENVRGGTAPVAAYEAVGYRAGDVFIDHEVTRTAENGMDYPVYEILSRQDFIEKYPQDVPDPMPVATVRQGFIRMEREKKVADSYLRDRTGEDHSSFDRALEEVMGDLPQRVEVG